MRINEVVRTGADNLSQQQVENMLKLSAEHFRSGAYVDTGATVKGLPVAKREDADQFIVVDEKEVIAKVTGKIKGGKYYVWTAGVGKKYKRQGYMTELYKALTMQLGYEVISDMHWTKGSEMLWKKLIADPQVNVNVYDMDEDKIIDLKQNKLPQGFFQDKNMRLILQGK